jgi:hypothetical protein
LRCARPHDERLGERWVYIRMTGIRLPGSKAFRKERFLSKGLRSGGERQQANGNEEQFSHPGYY